MMRGFFSILNMLVFAALMGALFVVPRISFAQEDEAFFDRCGCSQNVIRNLNNPDELAKYCEDDPLPQEIDFFASQPQVNTNFLSIFLKWIFGKLDANESAGDIARNVQSNFELPEVNMRLASPRPAEGDMVRYSLEGPGFVRPTEVAFDKLVVWFKNNESLQGVVAGGKEILPVEYILAEDQLSIVPDYNNLPTDVPEYRTRQSCRLAARQPENDRDGDGMDDLWECENFPQFFDGCEDLDTDVAYFGLLQVDPNDDPDNDGFLLDAPRRLLATIPQTFPLQDAPNLGFVVSLAPDSVGGRTGDGAFTNYEEYIWGTDPNNRDTNGDGLPDEASVAGVNQHVLEYRVNGRAMSVDTIRASAVGYTDQRRVFIDSETDTVIVNNRDPLEMELVMTPERPDAEHLPFFEASLFNAASGDDFIDFTWKFNGQYLKKEFAEGDVQVDCDKAEPGVACMKLFGGLGKRTLDVNELGLTFDPNSSHTVEVEAYEGPMSRKVFASRTFTIGSGLHATYTTLDVTAECADDVCALCQPTDPDNSPLDVGQGEYVRVVTAADFSYVADPRIMNYMWTLDGRRSQKQSGVDQTGFCFEVTARAGDEHIVEVEVVDQIRGRVEASETLAIFVMPISAELVVSAAVSSSSEVSARVVNMRNVPAGADVRFDWRVDGALIAEDSVYPSVLFIAGGPGARHTVRVGIEITDAEGGRLDTLTYERVVHVVGSSDDASAEAVNSSLLSGVVGLDFWQRVRSSVRNIWQ
jgi:hypothetical protein